MILYITLIFDVPPTVFVILLGVFRSSLRISCEAKLILVRVMNPTIDSQTKLFVIMLSIITASQHLVYNKMNLLSTLVFGVVPHDVWMNSVSDSLTTEDIKCYGTVQLVSHSRQHVFSKSDTVGPKESKHCVASSLAFRNQHTKT